MFTENSAEVDKKSPFINSYNVHARASASASSSSSASSSFYFNFYDPKKEKESENTEKPQENNDDDESQKFVEEVEQPISVENVEVPENCNQQNTENKEPVVKQPIKPEDKTQVEEVEQ